MYQYPDYLMHYGVLGMKWGRRKSRVTTSKVSQKSNAKKSNSSNVKSAIKVGAKVVGASLAIYGGYKVGKIVKNKRAIQKGRNEMGKMLNDAAYYRMWARPVRNSMLDFDPVEESRKAYQRTHS